MCKCGCLFVLFFLFFICLWLRAWRHILLLVNYPKQHGVCGGSSGRERRRGEVGDGVRRRERERQRRDHLEPQVLSNIVSTPYCLLFTISLFFFVVFFFRFSFSFFSHQNIPAMLTHKHKHAERMQSVCSSVGNVYIAPHPGGVWSHFLLQDIAAQVTPSRSGSFCSGVCTSSFIWESSQVRVTADDTRTAYRGQTTQENWFYRQHGGKTMQTGICSLCAVSDWIISDMKVSAEVFFSLLL